MIKVLQVAGAVKSVCLSLLSAAVALGLLTFYLPDDVTFGGLKPCTTRTRRGKAIRVVDVGCPKGSIRRQPLWGVDYWLRALNFSV